MIKKPKIRYSRHLAAYKISLMDDGDNSLPYRWLNNTSYCQTVNLRGIKLPSHRLSLISYLIQNWLKDKQTNDVQRRKKGRVKK